MRTSLVLILVAVAAVAGSVGCQSPQPGGRPAHISIPVLGEDAARAAGLSDEQARDALALCAAKCARCHQFYNPSPYSQAEWDRWMSKMSKKAHLKPEQEEILSRYLGAVRTAR